MYFITPEDNSSGVFLYFENAIEKGEYEV